MAMCFARKPYKIMFYNMENFFDTIDDPETRDEEFLPDGAKRWNTAKYDKKLHNMERVLFDIAAIDRDYPVVIGISEIEKRSILEDIALTRKLLPARYAICHYDSPDLRGVDVAFLYRPDVFKFEGSAEIPVRIASLPNWRTRGIVTMWGTIDGEPFLFMVSHWPSRLGGQAASAFKRNAAAEQMRTVADSVLKAGLGTLAYRDAWNLFDNIVLTENLATGSTGELKLVKDPYKKTKYYGNIFKPSYLIQQEGQYKGYPLRTFVGNNFQGGFSDHLPVFIYIAK